MRELFKGRGGQSLFLLLLISVIFVAGLYLASNYLTRSQARFSSQATDELIAVNLAESGIGLAEASIRDQINAFGGDWNTFVRTFGTSILAGVYRPIILSLFVDIPLKNNFLQECEDLEQELNRLLPPWQVDVKYRLTSVMPLGGAIAIGTIIKRWMPYINLEKQGTIEIIATAYNPQSGMRRMVAIEKELKVIDLTPPCSHYTFVYDSETPMPGARPFHFDSGAEGSERSAEDVKLAAREDADDPDALLNGAFEPFPLSTKGYLSIESWDIGQVMNIENFKPGEAFLKALFLPKGRVMLRGRNAPKICKNANIVEWLSNVKPQQYYFTLDHFFFEFPTRPLVIDIQRLFQEYYGREVGDAIFASLSEGALWGIRVPPRIDFPRFAFNERMINDFAGVAQLFLGGNWPAQRTLGGDPSINECLMAFSKEVLKSATGIDVTWKASPETVDFARQIENMDLTSKTEQVISMLQSLYGEKGGIDNYDIWEFLMAPYGKGSLTTNQTGAVSKPDKMGSTTIANGWSLPVLFRNNGHFWGCLIDPSSVVSGILNFSPKELAGDITTDWAEGARRFDEFKSTALKSMQAGKDLGQAAQKKDFGKAMSSLKTLTQLARTTGSDISTDLNHLAENIVLNPVMDGGVSVVLNTFLDLVPKQWLEAAQQKIVGDISGIKIINCLLFPRMEGKIYSGWYQMAACPTGYWTDLNAVGVGVAGTGGAGGGAAGGGSAGTTGGTVVPGIGNAIGAAGGTAGGGAGGGGSTGASAAAGETALGFPFDIPMPIPSAMGLSEMLTLISIEFMQDAYLLARECGPAGQGPDAVVKSFGDAAQAVGDAVRNFFSGKGDLGDKIRNNAVAILSAAEGPTKYIQFAFLKFKTFLEIFINGFLKSMRPYHKFSNGDDLTADENGTPVTSKADDLDEYLTDPQNVQSVSAEKPLANAEPLPMDAYRDRASHVIEGNLVLSGPVEIWGLWYVTGQVTILDCSISGMGAIVAQEGFSAQGCLVHTHPGHDFISLITDKTLSVSPLKNEYVGLHAAIYAEKGVSGRPTDKVKIYGNLVTKALPLPDYRPRIAVVFDSNIVNKPRHALAWFLPWNKTVAVLSERSFNYRVYAR